MRKAYCLIRPGPVYRSDAFKSGLQAAGYDVRGAPPATVDPGDLLVAWNRYEPTHSLCTRVEAQGGVCVVAENGYLGPGGVSPHQMEPRSIYALAIGGHNGSGSWSAGGPERWEALGVDLKPWRTDGEHILVLPNRSFGRPDLIMPVGWAESVKARLQRVTKRPVRIRQHPGNDAPKTPLADDLRGAWAAVIWSSSAGVQALISGIPVVCEAPFWVCKGAAFGGISADVIDEFWMPQVDKARLPAMRRLAWAQFSVSEIASGEAFDHLLQREAATA